MLILAAGLDARGLAFEAPVLQRDHHTLYSSASGRALLQDLVSEPARLVVLGPDLEDLTVADLLRRIRAAPITRVISVLVLLPTGDASLRENELLSAGANAVLRRPLDPMVLETWLAKLLGVPRRVDARVPVQGQIVGTLRTPRVGHFYGFSRNLSVNGMLLASPMPLAPSLDLDLEFSVPSALSRLRALGRVVREAQEVAWPYRGYGIEFLFLPASGLQAIGEVVTHNLVPRLDLAATETTHAIQFTLRCGAWIYEIREPVERERRWLAEIRRSPHESWRPGVASPFYVVEGPTPMAALEQAREFLRRRG